MDNNELYNEAENNADVTSVETDGKTAAETPEAEHVISYRPEDAQGNTAGGEYSSVLHTSAETEKQRKKDKKIKKEKKSVGAGLVASLVIGCMLISFGCGLLGAYLMGTSYGLPADGTADGAQSIQNPPVVIYKDPSVKTSAENGEFSYSDVEAVTGDSVVAISTEFMVQGLWGYVNQGAGSGVVMSADGYIITNNHVVASSTSGDTYADTITVRMKNGEEYDAAVIGGDEEADIAVIKVTLPENVSLTPAVFGDSDTLSVGEEVVAIGNPLGELSGTLTNGIISALAREVEVEGIKMNLLQTNAAINPGNSGGGLFNMDGKLVGIVNAKSSGTGIEGIGFAIPANDALETAEKIIENGGSVKDPTVIIGITTYNIQTVSDARKFGVNALGVYVYSAEKGYNDDVLKTKDRIIAVDGIEISSGADVSDIVKSHAAGDVLEFTIYREGKLRTVEVTCYSSETAPNK